MSVEPWVDVELKHAKSSYYDAWGRQVIQAIDLDDCIKLFEVFDSNKCRSKDANQKHIDAQVTLFGYGEYLWTSKVHLFIGDTALHMAIKQKKMMCVHILLILNASHFISNAAGETADALSIRLLKSSLENLKYESMKYILNNLNPKDFKRLPDNAVYRKVEEEAWMLLRAGRVMYSELPSSISTEKLEIISATERKAFLSFNAFRGDNDDGSVYTMDSQQVVDNLMAPAIEPMAPCRWAKLTDADGNEYYFDEVTGESSWEKPADYYSADAPAEPHMELASQEYHSYLTRLADDGDDRAEIEALKARIKHMEKIDKQRARDRERDQLKELTEARDFAAELAREQRRKAEDQARQEEIAALKEVMAQRILQNKERMRRRAEEERSGQSKTPGASATGDVWSRGIVSDVVNLIERQKKRRIALAAHSDQFVAKGLPLLSSVKMRTPAERVHLQAARVEAGDKLALQSIPGEMQNLEGIKKLKFLKMGQLSAAKDALLTPQFVPLSTHVGSLNISSPAKRILSSVSDKLLLGGNESNDRSAAPLGPMGKSFLYDSSSHVHTVDYTTSREVTAVSTASNLKYMKIGDHGLEDISAALRNDPIISTLCLSGARVSSVGVVALATVLPTTALTYLDLTCNLVCDTGAAALAAAITSSSCRLQKLLLAGNRIRLKGAIELLLAFFESNVEWISLRNNSLSREDGQQLEKLMEERDFCPQDEVREVTQTAHNGAVRTDYPRKPRDKVFVKKPPNHFSHTLVPRRRSLLVRMISGESGSAGGSESEDSKREVIADNSTIVDAEEEEKSAQNDSLGDFSEHNSQDSKRIII